jgi:NAD(P)-dependent dehydrogenase (short-subunit alcohol dehydrogenase family)
MSESADRFVRGSTASLAGRVALITGGAGGIGVAVARRLARAGCRLALADRRLDAAETAAGQMRKLGVEAIAIGGDVSLAADAEALVAATLAHYGRIEILVNNAGVMGRSAPLQDLRDEDWRLVMSVDLDSVFYVTRAVIRHMRTAKRGAIVSVASIAGKEGTPNLIPYSVAKAGIIAFTKSLGKEVIREGIRVNCVAPAVVDTPLLDQLPEEATQLMLSKAPMGRFGTADEVAAVVQFLASDDASFITAQCLDASGGRATY